MLPEYTLKQVIDAWNVFNKLQTPHIGAFNHIYKDREIAWREYIKIRDHFLYSAGAIKLNELNRLWYPKTISHSEQIRYNN